jgi:transcriptional regulator with XRE-family HTH domain
VGLVLGSARTLGVVKDSGICANLRYGHAVRWTPEKIKRRRHELGDTQEEFAERVGLSLRTITAWETGESRPRRTTELDKLGPPRPLAEPPSPLEEIDLSSVKVPDLATHLVEVATELSRRLSAGHAPEFTLFESDRPNLREHLGKYVPEDLQEG